jgi:hypothetical protein
MHNDKYAIHIFSKDVWNDNRKGVSMPMVKMFCDY